MRFERARAGAVLVRSFWEARDGALCATHGESLYATRDEKSCAVRGEGFPKNSAAVTRKQPREVYDSQVDKDHVRPVK